MRILYVFCHPLPESFHAAIRAEALAGLAQAGHEVDLLDLYAENFDPVMSAAGRRAYHEPAANRAANQVYVDRLMAAEGLVLQFPVWSFGPPAMLKGWFDRMFGPGIALDLSNPARVEPMLRHIRKIAGITTYGRSRWRAIAMADPPRKIITRYLPWFTGGQARAAYYPLYHMNVATEPQRRAFMARVRGKMAAF